MYKKHVLENGLTIIGEEIPYVKSSICYLKEQKIEHLSK